MRSVLPVVDVVLPGAALDPVPGRAEGCQMTG